jgi:Tol biopolymer transport system component
VAAPALAHVSGLPPVKPASVNSAGDFATGDSSTEGSEQLSGDGHLYVFQAYGANLPHGGDMLLQSYLHNFKTGKTQLLSRNSNGKPANGFTENPVISPSGKLAVFDGQPSNLPGGGPDDTEVWVRNLKTGKVELVSRTPKGKPGKGGPSFLSFISANDRYVAFDSRAKNMPAGDGATSRVYIRDLKKQKTILASRNSHGKPVEGNAYGQPLSANGKLLVFSSGDPLLPGKSSVDHIYLRDLKTGKVRLIDKFHGEPANDFSHTPALSENGRYIAYESTATNLPGPGVDGGGYVYDRKTGKTKLVTRNSAGDPAVGGDVRISADGKMIAFDAQDAALPGGGAHYQVYARNLKTGKTTLMSHTPADVGGNGDSYYPSLSADGRFVAFEGYATDLGGSPPGTHSEAYRSGPLP